MNELVTPIDIEAALAGYLFGKGVTASAPPLSADYADRLPFVLITRTGGSQRSRVLSTHSIDVDVYAATWAEAQSAANRIAGYVAQAELEDLTWRDGALTLWCPCYTSKANMPYNNPDPRHPNVPRVTFSATVTTRAFVSELTI